MNMEIREKTKKRGKIDENRNREENTDLNKISKNNC